MFIFFCQVPRVPNFCKDTHSTAVVSVVILSPVGCGNNGGRSNGRNIHIIIMITANKRNNVIHSNHSRHCLQPASCIPDWLLHKPHQQQSSNRGTRAWRGVLIVSRLIESSSEESVGWLSSFTVFVIRPHCGKGTGYATPLVCNQDLC